MGGGGGGLGREGVSPLDTFAHRESGESLCEGDGFSIRPVSLGDCRPDHSQTGVSVLAHLVDSDEAGPAFPWPHLPIGLRHRVAQERRDVDSTDLDFGWGLRQVEWGALLDFGSGIGTVAFQGPNPQRKSGLHDSFRQLNVSRQVAAVATFQADEGKVQESVSLDRGADNRITEPLATAQTMLGSCVRVCSSLTHSYSWCRNRSVKLLPDRVGKNRANFRA